MIQLSMRQRYDIRSLWTLTGIAVRIGQRIGLHRDGASLELPPFEVEIRRRVWWQIVLLDSRIAELSGLGTSILAHLWDTKLPSNVNDSDLSPDMTALPTEHTGITEMVFCLIRYSVGEFLRHSSTTSAFDGSWQKLSNSARSLTDKDKAIDELENLIEHKYLKYCDPLNPLHFLSAIMARSAICKMRLVAHHPRKYQDRGAQLPQQEKDMLFNNSLKMIEYDNLVQSTQSTQKFLWHVNVHLQLDACVYMLSELRHRTTGERVERAWRQLDEVYENHPEMIDDTKNTLNVAFGNLTIKAWEAREAQLVRLHQGTFEAASLPRCVSKLRSQRITARAAQTTSPSDPNGPITPLVNVALEQTPENATLLMATSCSTSNGSHFDSAVSPGPMSMGMSPLDWAYWDSLLQGSDMQDLINSGQKVL